ncbi:MAG: Hint domain-containing protein [Candidatus Azobacteroides sp.]|nr:Hint domain-containing protein [Candidatus Azobacteroides sp.]
MKKTVVLFICTFFISYCSGQSVPIIEANVREDTYPDDDDFRTVSRYMNIYSSMFNERWEKVKTEEDLLPEERQYMEEIREKYTQFSLEDGEVPWEVMGPGCSWYCGAHYRMEASSTLASSGKNTYGVDNLWDDDVRTAWVEGVKGYGVGEYITFAFPEGSPRATECQIVTGYSKDEKTWKNNSRVKTLSIYEDDNLISIVHLKDTRAIQTFPLINHRRDKRAMTLKFVITDIYKGDKYEDTAISELVFDGEDVHCFVAGTLIKMADGSDKSIEEIKAGDNVISYDTEKNTFFINEVHSLHHTLHEEVITLSLENGMTVTTTGHHPFLSVSGWMSFYPETTGAGMLYKEVETYKQGSSLASYLPHGDPEFVPVSDIKISRGTRQTYTLKLEEKGCFVANGFIVGQE